MTDDELAENIAHWSARIRDYNERGRRLHAELAEVEDGLARARAALDDAHAERRDREARR